MLGAPAIASSIGRTTESRNSDGGAPGYDALTDTTGKSMLGVFCCTSVASANAAGERNDGDEHEDQRRPVDEQLRQAHCYSWAND